MVSRSLDYLRLWPFYIIKASTLPTISCRCMSCAPVKVKVIVAIVTSNLISHIMILLAFVITTWLVDNFFVFWIRANCNVRKVAVRTGDRKVIQCSFLSLGLSRNYTFTNSKQTLQSGHEHIAYRNCFPVSSFPSRKPLAGLENSILNSGHFTISYFELFSLKYLAVQNRNFRVFKSGHFWDTYWR